ncbi:MAG: type II toxin-antitoxin system Phd/YefM family antitoxin [Terriglobia bacterium]
MSATVKTMSATEFKAKCLKILDELGPEGVIVTKRGKPVAKVTPVRQHTFDQLYGCMKGKVKIKGDIFSTGRKWNAQTGKW